MDGTLCRGVCWTPKQCLNAKPNKKVIQKVNKMANECYLVIWTARRNHLIPATIEWCRKHGIHFQAISNNKSAGDLYIDDNCVNVRDLL